jgi:hypothetical protein
MRIANPFIMIAHVIASLHEADVGQQSADTIKFGFRFRFPWALRTTLRSGTRQALAQACASRLPAGREQA